MGAMQYHPGGPEHTRQLLELGALPPGARVLDMGAGAGEAVALARAMGFEAAGIDLAPRGPGVEPGDFLAAPYPGGSFDGILSQCSFHISGDASGAIREAARLLKPGGVLMLSDVYPVEEDPADMARGAGLTVETEADMTRDWRAYFLQALWEEEPLCIPAGKKYRYKMMIARKGRELP